jgi:hypothetical protein
MPGFSPQRFELSLKDELLSQTFLTFLKTVSIFTENSKLFWKIFEIFAEVSEIFGNV